MIDSVHGVSDFAAIGCCGHLAHLRRRGVVEGAKPGAPAAGSTPPSCLPDGADRQPAPRGSGLRERGSRAPDAAPHAGRRGNHPGKVWPERRRCTTSMGPRAGAPARRETGAAQSAPGQNHSATETCPDAPRCLGGKGSACPQVAGHPGLARWSGTSTSHRRACCLTLSAGRVEHSFRTLGEPNSGQRRLCGLWPHNRCTRFLAGVPQIKEPGSEARPCGWHRRKRQASRATT